MPAFENDNFLLSCLFNSGGLNSIDWPTVATQNGYSHPGTGRNRFIKLRKAYEAAVAAGGVPTSPPPTPSGKKRGRKPKGWVADDVKEEGGAGKKLKFEKADGGEAAGKENVNENTKAAVKAEVAEEQIA